MPDTRWRRRSRRGEEEGVRQLVGLKQGRETVGGVTTRRRRRRRDERYEDDAP